MRRCVLCLLPFLLAVLLLAACRTSGEPPPEEGIRIWFMAQEGSSALGWEVFPAQAATPSAEQLAVRLLQGPADGKLRSPFPYGVRLLGCMLDGGVLTLDLSEPYRTLTGAALTAADACFVLTLCQLDGVEAVCTTVEGQLPPGRARHILSPDDLILSGAGEEPVYVTAVLYFPRLEGRGLGVEHRSVVVEEGGTVSFAIATALVSGPDTDALGAAVPNGTVLLDVSVTDRICAVNLSSAFRDGLPERQEDAHLLIYSLVDTLGNLENVDAVQILVEGEPLNDYPDIPLSRPLEPDFRMTEDF